MAPIIRGRPSRLCDVYISEFAPMRLLAARQGKRCSGAADKVLPVPTLRQKAKPSPALRNHTLLGSG